MIKIISINPSKQKRKLIYHITVDQFKSKAQIPVLQWDQKENIHDPPNTNAQSN